MLFRKGETASAILAVALLVATPAFITSTVNHISSQAHATSRIVDIGEAYSPSNAFIYALAQREE